MEYKRMLFDAEGVSLGCTVGAGLWPAFQLPMGTWRGCLLPCLSTSGSRRCGLSALTLWLTAYVLPGKGFLFAL